MKGRLLYALVAVATLCLYPAAGVTAASTAVDVHWHAGGLLTWERVEHRTIVAPTIHRFVTSLEPGHSKVVAAGSPGVRELRVVYAQRDGGPVRSHVLASAVVRAARPRILAVGVGATPLAGFAAHGVAHMAFEARSAMEMLATAYTAQCGGCDGWTAIGRRAGFGIVAVDPRVIPLGTRLYIPGYGVAIAGDTGGAILGNRIDLGFDSWRDAMLFGRRSVTVYRLK